MRPPARVLATALLLGAGAQAQEPPAAVFPAEATSVEVDAVVLDARGEPVRGLTRDDFQVFEEGTRQEVASFDEVTLPADAVPVTAGALARDVATNEGARDGRIYTVVLDEAHTDGRRSALVRKAAGEFIQRHLAPEDVAAVVSASARPDAVQAFTGDKRLLLEAVNGFSGRKARSATVERSRAIDHQHDLRQGPRDPAEANAVPRYGMDTDPSDALRAQAARGSLALLQDAVGALRGLSGRRKAVLFISEGVDYDTLDVTGRVQRHASEVQAGFRNVIAAAARANVAVYAIDPRGLGGPSGDDDMELSAPPPERGFGIDARSLHRERRRAQDSLRLVAEQTGGEAILDTNDLSTAYGRIVRASSHYYRIGYQPSDFRPDGAFRRIEVRVARPGVSVIARKGYARPRAGEDRRRAERPAPTGTSSELRELLHRPWPQGGLPLGVSAAVFKVTAASATVAVTVQVPGRALASGNGAAGEVELALIAVDESGRVQAGDRVLVPPGWDGEAREVVQRQGLRFVRRIELAAGRHELRVAMREGAGGRRGSVFYDLQVPHYAETKLAMSGVLLTSRAAAETPTLAFDDVVRSLLDSPPTVARTFAPDDVLTVYAEVYDALEGAHDLAVTTRVTGADGAEVLRADEQRASSALQAGGGGVRHRIEIPLARFAPGTYVLRTEAAPTAGGSRAARELSFEVRPGLAARASADIGSLPAAPSARWTGPRPASRMDRLAAWLAAVEAHQPGEPDGPAVMVRSWPAADLAELATDATTLARLMRDPGYPVTWRVDPARPGRPERAPYTLADEQRLRAAAREAAARCGARIPPSPADRACASNPLLKRGAMLHTDAAVLFAEDEGPGPSAGGDLRPDRWRVRYADGQQQHTEGASGHWDLAQVLLAGVAPHPARDETVRLWYVAVGAYGQYHERHTRLEDRAAELFPDDPDVLFLAGTLHEAFASPRIQRLVRTMRLPAGTTHGIGSERSELRKAEGFLRRALEQKPGLVEARIRWGRVLHRLGRHEQSVRELQKAVEALAPGGLRAGDEGALLGYFAEMFLGAAAESLGRRDLARASYRRAVGLRGSAPSPRLALSRLALADNDRGAALDAVREALRPDPDRHDDADPWWRYHVVQGRRVDTWFEALRRSLTAPP